MGQTDLQELNRNMDDVFDAIQVLNTAMTAMVQSLEPKAAARFAQQLDEAIDGLGLQSNPPDSAARRQLYSWRNRAGSLVGLSSRRSG